MEFSVPHDSHYNASKAFLANEKGDNNENITKKKTELKDFISEQTGNDMSQNSGERDESVKSSNIPDYAINQNDLEDNKKIVGKDITFNITNGTHINEHKKLNDSKLADECGKECKTNESLVESKNKSEIKEEEDESKIKLNRKDKIESSQPEVLPNSVGGSNLTNESLEQKEESKDEWMDILGSGQLKKKVLKQGVPDSRPQKGDVCIINLTGKLEDGTIFEQQKGFEINTGDNEVVQGLDFALALMDKEEEAEVIVAPRFGYGSLGYKPLVPPDSTLYFCISLIDVKPEPLISTLNINERIAIGGRKKEKGNWWYTRDEQTLAIHSYRRALEYLDDTDIPDDSTLEQTNLLLEERLKTYNNLGASQLKISAYDAALISIDQVLNCQPKNLKALFRKSKILKEKGELSKSIEVIRQALAIEPDSKGLQQELSQLLAAKRKDNSKQRDLYKKMMGGNNTQDSESEKKKKVPYNAFKWIVAFSFAVAVIGAVAFKYRL